MSDWDFLHEMNNRGYSPEDIADAAGSGAAPWEWDYIAKQENNAEWGNLKSLRNSRSISRAEFLKRKAAIFGD
jgi:hypothetical protein